MPGVRSQDSDAPAPDASLQIRDLRVAPMDPNFQIILPGALLPVPAHVVAAAWEQGPR